MAGPAGADSNGSNGVLGRLLANDRLTLAILAIIFGGASSLGFNRFVPPSQELVRPDPWTGTQAREAHDAIKAEMRELELRCEQHNSKPAHREQAQLNSEILWRIQKLEQQTHEVMR